MLVHTDKIKLIINLLPKCTDSMFCVSVYLLVLSISSVLIAIQLKRKTNTHEIVQTICTIINLCSSHPYYVNFNSSQVKILYLSKNIYKTCARNINLNYINNLILKNSSNLYQVFLIFF